MVDSLELWCSWLSRLLYTQKVLGSNPSSSTFFIIIMQRTTTQEVPPLLPNQLTDHSAEIEYVKNNVDPILSEMMVKIVNEDPKDVLSFMLKYLREMRATKNAN